MILSILKSLQAIHVENRPNHGAPHHIKNLNWCNQNIDILFNMKFDAFMKLFENSFKS